MFSEHITLDSLDLWENQLIVTSDRHWTTSTCLFPESQNPQLEYTPIIQTTPAGCMDCTGTRSQPGVNDIGAGYIHNSKICQTAWKAPLTSPLIVIFILLKAVASGAAPNTCIGCTWRNVSQHWCWIIQQRVRIILLLWCVCTRDYLDCVEMWSFNQDQVGWWYTNKNLKHDMYTVIQ